MKDKSMKDEQGDSVHPSSNHLSSRILGIDPGLQCTGWGVVDCQANQLSFVACGAIKTKADAPMEVRLLSLNTQLSDIIKTHKPDAAAVEETFVNKNSASSLKLGQARGALILTLAQHGLSVEEYAANLVKKSVVGAGHADKNQVATMVQMILPACKTDSADAADALAVAICHAHHASTRIRAHA